MTHEGLLRQRGGTVNRFDFALRLSVVPLAQPNHVEGVCFVVTVVVVGLRMGVAAHRARETLQLAALDFCVNVTADNSTLASLGCQCLPRTAVPLTPLFVRGVPTLGAPSVTRSVRALLALAAQFRERCLARVRVSRLRVLAAIGFAALAAVGVIRQALVDAALGAEGHVKLTGMK